MKDRDGNEWVLVPVKATDAMVRAAMSAVNGALLYRWAQSVTDAIIAAAPQFVAGEVTRPMCHGAWARFWSEPNTGDSCDQARRWLEAWRAELGPALGLETQRHRDNEIDALEQKLARADARIAEMERDNERIDAQWRDELRIYRETENKRIAELEQSVTVRDTEIARLETDLELARRDAERINRLSAHLADDITICPPGKHGKGDGWLIFWQTGWDNYGQIGEETHGATLRDAIDAARAGNGGGV